MHFVFFFSTKSVTMRTKMEIKHFIQDTKLLLPAVQRETQNWNLCYYQPHKMAHVDALHNSNQYLLYLCTQFV